MAAGCQLKGAYQMEQTTKFDFLVLFLATCARTNCFSSLSKMCFCYSLCFYLLICCVSKKKWSSWNRIMNLICQLYFIIAFWMGFSPYYEFKASMTHFPETTESFQQTTWKFLPKGQRDQILSHYNTQNRVIFAMIMLCEDAMFSPLYI